MDMQAQGVIPLAGSCDNDLLAGHFFHFCNGFRQVLKVFDYMAISLLMSTSVSAWD